MGVEIGAGLFFHGMRSMICSHYVDPVIQNRGENGIPVRTGFYGRIPFDPRFPSS